MKMMFSTDLPQRRPGIPGTYVEDHWTGKGLTVWVLRKDRNGEVFRIPVTVKILLGG